MNGNYLMIFQLITMVMLILLTGYIVLPLFSRPRILPIMVVVLFLENVWYEKNENLQIRDYTAFEKYEIWRFTERRKTSLALLGK